MKFSYVAVLAALACISTIEARSSILRREVPQEHSHEAIITAMRTLVPFGSANIRKDGKLPDPVFGCLANPVAAGAAPGGDAICLQQNIADTGISLAAGDKKKIALALKYRALERNSKGVGTRSDLCTKEPINAILKGLTQHQDPASAGATEFNKNVELTLAKKLASIGADPLEALETATFAPGDKTDGSGKGKTCDDANDKAGCIFTQKLNKPIATAAEIKAAVAGTSTGGVTAAVTTAKKTAKKTAKTAAKTVVPDTTKILDDMASKLDSLEKLLA